MKYIAGVIVCLFMGCASTDAVKIGPDLYMISITKKGFYDENAIRAKGIEAAADWCKKNNKEFELVEATGQKMKPFQSDPSAQVTFKALPIK